MSIKNTILGLLDIQPQYGYELLAAFSYLLPLSAGKPVNAGQIYSTLERLEKANLVEKTETIDPSDGRIAYTITPDGKEALLHWLNTPVKPDTQRDELTLKILLAFRLPDIKPQQVIVSQRKYLYQALHRYITRREELPPLDIASRSIYDKAILHLEADLRWLDLLEGRLDEICKQDLPQPELRPRGRPRRES